MYLTFSVLEGSLTIIRYVIYSIIVTVVIIIITTIIMIRSMPSTHARTRTYIHVNQLNLGIASWNQPSMFVQLVLPTPWILNILQHRRIIIPIHPIVHHLSPYQTIVYGANLGANPIFIPSWWLKSMLNPSSCFFSYHIFHAPKNQCSYSFHIILFMPKKTTLHDIPIVYHPSSNTNPPAARFDQATPHWWLTAVRILHLFQRVIVDEL